MDLGAAAEGLALVSLAGKSLASLAVAIFCVGLAALGWFSRNKWYLLACLVFLLADLVYLAFVVVGIGIGQLPMFAPTLGTILAVGVTAIVGLSRCRPRIQFRLRTLLIAILVVSLPLSWFAVRLNRARKQEQAIKEIYRLGGCVLCDMEIVDPNRGYHPPTERIRGVLRDVFAVKPIQILLLKKFDRNDSSSTPQEIEVCDDDLSVLVDMEGIWSLRIESSQVTDKGLRHLYNLKDLAFLDLIDTQVTPESVNKLQRALPDCYIDCQSSDWSPGEDEAFSVPNPGDHDDPFAYHHD